MGGSTVGNATGAGVDRSGDKGESPSDKDRGGEDVADRLDGSVDGVGKGVWELAIGE